MTETFDTELPLTRFCTLAAEQAGQEPEDVTEDSLVADLDMDSLDLIELAMAVEEAVNGSIDEQELSKALTAGSLKTLKDVWLWMREKVTA